MLALAEILAAFAFVLPPQSGNHPPNAPTITEPATDNLTLSPADVHMEQAPFSDPDPGDHALCTDWEIWTVTPSERVWHADCATGTGLVHVHLGDGVFENSHAGRSDLMPSTNFVLRVRDADDSGDPATMWSAWSTRPFHTGTESQTFPLLIEDVSALPVPRWTFASDGSPVILPSTSRAPRLALESASGDLLLEIRATDGTANAVTTPPALSEHVAVRVRLDGGDQPVTIPPSDLAFVDDHCQVHTILLPTITFYALTTHVLWVSNTGSTFWGDPSQTDPTFGWFARGPTIPWVPRTGFRLDVFASGLSLPVNLAFLPNAGPNPDDPFLYVTELYGAIRVVSRDGTVSTFADNLLNYDPTGVFPGSGEQGVAGLAIDPATGDVYANLLYDSGQFPGQHWPKIVRFTSLDGGRTAATETTVLDMPGETQGQSHQISNLSFGPDGKLYCHMGDGFDTATAQDLGSFRGKILRLNLDGSAPSDNPFYDASDGITSRDYVYAYGVRNPFGGDWRAADGMPYEVENGPSVDRFAKLVAGRNYLWDGSDASMHNYAIWNWAPAHGPVNLAFVQPETFGGSGFPASVMGHAFVSESGPTHAQGPQELGKRVTEFILDANGNLVAGPIPFLEYAGTGWATAVGLAAGPDGLYVTELYPDTDLHASNPGARILRVRYDPFDDCDGNGVSDVCDIASGTSTDVNGDWIPDVCETSAVPFCFGDGTGAPCPCGNTGAAGRGCANSAVPAGARLAATGSAFLSQDTLVLSATDERPTSFSLFFQGDAETAPASFGDGIACLGGHLVRLYLHDAVGGAVNGPQGSDLPVSARSAVLGDPIAPGGTRVYHVVYRDPDPAFCPAPSGSTVNATNGVRVLWGP
jgi:glucose/arabinose dehydrogenase